MRAEVVGLGVQSCEPFVPSQFVPIDSGHVYLFGPLLAAII